MKKITFSSIFFLFCFLGFSQEHQLIGKWSNTTDNNKGEKFEFRKDQTAIMTKEGTDSPPFKYSFNTKKTPNWVDLTIDEEDFKMTMQGLVEFIDENTVKLELFPETSGDHPSKFSLTTDSNDITYIILKRI